MTALIAEFSIGRDHSFELDVAMTAPDGHTVALLGPNGAGKSTTLAVLAGLSRIDAGRIALGDTIFDDPAGGVFVQPEQRSVGVVFQGILLFDHLTVVDNVAFGLRSRGVGRAAARERSRDWLGRVGLEGFDDRLPADLSGGQAQRVALARALATEPDVLLLDEPMSALDITSRWELRRVLAEHLRAFEGPRILVTHDPAEAFLLADEIHVIEEGRITQRGSPDEIRIAPRTRYAADLAGINLVRGEARGGTVVTDSHELHIADIDVTGQVLVTIHPAAVAVHAKRPAGSPRNVWRATIERTERIGNRVRLAMGEPLKLTVEVTADSMSEMGLDPGTVVWLAVKATEIGVSTEGA